MENWRMRKCKERSRRSRRRSEEKKSERKNKCEEQILGTRLPAAGRGKNGKKRIYTDEI